MENWKESAKVFFDTRASFNQSEVSLQQLCYMSGRDPRIWATSQAQQGLADDISQAVGLAAHADVLEVGCGSGYVAAALSPRVANYIGVDMAAEAIRVARSLNLANVDFTQADGEKLPFDSDVFDRVVFYCVINNFPSFDDVMPVLAEMYRVVAPGGRVLVGCVPDAARSDDYMERARQLTVDLEASFGTVKPEDVFDRAQPKDGILGPLIRKFLAKAEEGGRFGDAGQISCYFFSHSDFEEVARNLGALLSFTTVHNHPYSDLMYHAVLQKPSA